MPPAKVHIIQIKLAPGTIAELYALVSEYPQLMTLCPELDEAQVVVTGIHMRQRLERHLDWETAGTKAIVTPEWLRESAKQGVLLPYADYAAIRALIPRQLDPRDASPSILTPPSSPEPQETLEQPHYSSRYACLRPCPLESPNQELARQLAVIRKDRELDGNATSALVYERAISVIIAYPHKITTARMNELAKLPFMGEKMLAKVEEYIESGTITESQKIAASGRFRALSAFTTIYGIGPSTARKLFDVFGLRTFDELVAHFSTNELPYLNDDRSESRIQTRAPTLKIQAALALREELNERIPRTEVETMHSVVMAELEQIKGGCTGTIVGGYRRGKAYSNDVDIVITHPSLANEPSLVSDLCEKLVNQLFQRGLITHLMHLGSFLQPGAPRHPSLDTIEKALTVFRLPPQLNPRGVHRRLDLIVVAPETYWTAIVGWTGSKMFERDLRLWAKERGLNFDSSGITRRSNGKQYFPQTEEDVFSVMGLGYLDPTLRNADA
uniref:DNA polymerase n=1 Tax=Mycena chlorophos TaxID=658473 RepID=A0ABQ0M3J7_MYCCL|nr:predicted protein [Mycena chlorophos]